MKGATCRKIWKTEIQSCQEKRNQTSKKKKKKPTKNKQTKKAPKTHTKQANKKPTTQMKQKVNKKLVHKDYILVMLQDIKSKPKNIS